jgi:Protein of unknown function (DUF3460)
MKPQPSYRQGNSGYVSEFEQFLNGYVSGHPRVAKDQERGWYLLWDKHVNFDEIAKARQDAVPVKSYYYE